MKTVKYRTSCLGNLPLNTIIEISLLAEQDNNTALLFAPKDKDGCGCLIFATMGANGIYEDYPGDNWINMEGSNIDPAFNKFLKTIKQPMKIIPDEDKILKQHDKKFHQMIKDTIKWIKSQKWYTNKFDLEGYIDDLIFRINH